MGNATNLRRIVVIAFSFGSDIRQLGELVIQCLQVFIQGSNGPEREGLMTMLGYVNGMDGQGRCNSSVASGYYVKKSYTKWNGIYHMFCSDKILKTKAFAK